MAYQSPYRGGDGLSARTRELISRGTLLAVGLAMAYFSVRGGFRLHELYAGNGQAVVLATSSSGQPVLNPAFTWPWAAVIGCGFLALTMVAAAVIPVSVMQRLFERFNRPPASGVNIDDPPWWFLWWPW